MARQQVRRICVLLLLIIGLLVSVTKVFHDPSRGKAIDFKSPNGQNINNEFSQIKIGESQARTPSNSFGDGAAILHQDSNDQGFIGAMSTLEGIKTTLDYREIFSLTTLNRTYMPMLFGLSPGYNPNIIPHPTNHELWIVIAQQPDLAGTRYSAQIACDAVMFDNKMICTTEPKALPVEPNVPGNCQGDLVWVSFVAGPRDARVFYGPDVPYITYGSLSQYHCFGQWVQDVRMLLDEFAIMRHVHQQFCAKPIEIQRAPDSDPAFREIEKNHFMFWDAAGLPYVHYDLWPTRSFAALNFNGAGVKELASASAINDKLCIAKYFPKVGESLESIHQATNSLSITMCARSSPGCVPNDDNTYIMHIFHHKTYYDFHGVYEPYVVLFKRSAPFGLVAVSQRPLWISGRKELSVETDSVRYRDKPEDIPKGHTEMFYVTSMNWKSHGQKYHGYMDDVLFVNFGIEDTRAGTIDVKAADLLQDLAYC